MRLARAALIESTIVVLVAIFDFYCISEMLLVLLIAELVTHVTLEVFLGSLVTLHQVGVRRLRLFFGHHATVLGEPLLALYETAHNFIVQLLLTADLTTR